MAKGDINDPFYYNFTDGVNSSVVFAVGLGEITGSTLRVAQASDAISSTFITNASIPVSGTFYQATQPISAGESLEVRQVSGAMDSVAVVGTVAVTGTVTALASGIYDVTPTLPLATDYLPVRMTDGVSFVTGGLTNTELRASAIEILQVSGSGWSTYVTGTAASTYAEILNPDGRVKVELPSGASSLTNTELRASSLPVEQVSGSNWSTNVTNTVTVSVSGSISSTVVVGPILHDSVDDGSAPQKVGGTAMTANPTAVAGGDIVRFVADKIGRQLVTPYQVRNLITTARVSLTNVAPTTLLAGGGAGVFHDLISVTCSFTSTAADTAAGSFAIVDILEVQSGGPVLTLVVKNGQTVIYQPSAPISQSEGGSAWMVDITNDLSTLATTPVVVTALFAKNI